MPRAPHDRHPVPLVALLVPGGELDRGLLAVAGVALLLVTLGGLVFLVTLRRGLKLALLGALALVAVVPAGADAVPYAPIPTCSPGPANCSSWHTTDVSVSWQFEPGWTSISCDSRPVTHDTATEQRTCSVSYGPDDTLSRTVTVRRDAMPPQLTAANPSRAPDSNGWYNKPFSVAFVGTDATSGIASCTNPSYGGADGSALTIAGTCTDVAGNSSAPMAFSFNYDATAPVVTPAPERQPDGAGWYRRPVLIGFNGTDLTSGIAACSTPARYVGPDRAEAAVVGRCQDTAGNAAEAGFVFKYDATPPRLTAARAELVKDRARVTWNRAPDVARLEIFRTPGINGRKRTSVYKGVGTGFTDRTVKNGQSYRYEIVAADVAGNLARTTVSVTARGPLYSPGAGDVVRPGPVILRWQPVRGARFYNVQLYRNGRKVLTVWPRGAPLKLGATWSYLGKRQRLEPGRYRWYVWAARGTRAQPSYGPPLGTSVFVVRRR